MGQRGHGARATLLGLLLATVACGGPTAPAASVGGVSEQPAAPRRLTVAMMGDPPQIIEGYQSAHQIVGYPELTDIVGRGLTILNRDGALAAQLAEQVPTVENGLWKLFPDGRMETSWRIRPDARWHDGTPVTSADFLLASRAVREPQLPTEPPDAYNFIDVVSASDPQTLSVTWKRPYVNADAVFGTDNLPLPAHILDQPYADNPATFLQNPYWADDFVGTGPYRLKSWVRGSYMVLTAFEQFPLGRPKIDEITFRTIPDTGTLAANILAGEVELTLGRSLSLDQGAQVKDLWRGGDVIPQLQSWVALWPQLLTPSPSVIGNPQFRRALLHAIDRQQLVDTLQWGLTSVPDSYLSPQDPDYDATSGAIVRYNYDPLRALQLVEGLGYTRGNDGVLADATGQRLTVEIRSTMTDDLQLKTAFASADFWKQLGVAAEVLPSSLQLQQDREYRATYPGFESVRQPNDLISILRFHSSRTPTAENRWVGNNRIRYVNPDFDALVERYQATIPRKERMEIGTQLIRLFMENALALGLFYQAQPLFIGHRVRNAALSKGSQTWNVHQWDVG